MENQLLDAHDTYFSNLIFRDCLILSRLKWCGSVSVEPLLREHDHAHQMRQHHTISEDTKRRPTCRVRLTVDFPLYVPLPRVSVAA